MKKYLFLCSLFCILTFQPAYAQKYEYTGHNTPTYININGEQYVRIPRKNQNPSPKYETYSSQTSKNNTSPKYHPLSSSTKLKPYMGLDIGYNKLDRTTLADEHITEFAYVSYTQFPKNNITLSGILGLQLNPNFSLEAYYQSTIADDERNGTTTITNSTIDTTHIMKSSTQLSFISYGLDAIYSHPIYNQTFQLLTSLGLGSYDIKAKYKIHSTYANREDAILNANNQSIGYRLGLGAQYNFNNHLSLRAMIRYVKLTDDKIIDNITEFSTGLRYYF